MRALAPFGLLLGLLLASSSASPVPRPADGPDFSALRASIRARLTQMGVPSVAVAVAKDGKIVWEEGFGWADREQRRPATEHTLYSLASISKPIAATGLMVLRRRGRVDLDHPINDYLGEAKLRAWVGDAAGATVRRVMNHTSGLPLHYQFFYADEPYPRPSMDETIRRYGNLVRPPGEKFVYSNLGYGILGHVISRLSRRSYADFLRTEVFVPLGMTHASVDIGPGLAPYAATRYGKDGLPIPFYDFDHPGASAIFCSAHDLVRFGMFHLKEHLPDQKAILSDADIDLMQTTPTLGAGYALGWFVDEVRGYREVSHTGGMGGVTTTLNLVPSEGIAVVVLSNANGPLPITVKNEILALLLPHHGPIPAKKDDAQAPAKAPSKPVTGRWRGKAHTYRGDRMLTLWFLESGDVHARLDDQLKALVNDVRWDGDELTGEMVGDIGTPDADRRPYHLHLDLKRRGDTLTGSLAAISLPGKRDGNALSYPVVLDKLP